MKTYIGTKIVHAKPMNRLDYNIFRGWELPKDEDGTDEGYLVEYTNGGTPNTSTYKGYVSWCPKEQFENSNKETKYLTFGNAIEAAKQGFKITREGWNGKGMFVVYQKGYPEGIKCNKQTADAWGMKEGELFKCEPYLQIQMVNGSHAMWVPSVNDVLSEDWQIKEQEEEV